MTIRKQIADCFQTCRECEDCYSIKVDATHSIFVLVQENPDYNDGTLEYFIELNDISSGNEEPCARYNPSCPMDNLDDFENVIIEYLEDNGICV